MKFDRNIPKIGTHLPIQILVGRQEQEQGEEKRIKQQQQQQQQTLNTKSFWNLYAHHECKGKGLPVTYHADIEGEYTYKSTHYLPRR